MKKVIILCLFIFFGNTFAQTNSSRVPDYKVKYFQDFICFKGENNKTKLDVFIQVPYNAVQFIKTGQGFEASYSITVSVHDEENENLITEKIWNEKIVAISFELTASSENFNLGHRTFELSPGIYSIKTTLFDKDSKNEYSSENKIKVKENEFGFESEKCLFPQSYTFANFTHEYTSSIVGSSTSEIFPSSTQTLKTLLIFLPSSSGS